MNGKWIATLTSVALICAAALPTAYKWAFGRDLRCELQTQLRSRAICEAIQMQSFWQWFDGSSIYPEWTITPKRTADVFCEENVTLSDAASLTEMALKASERKNDTLFAGGTWLLSLLGKDVIPILEKYPITNGSNDEKSLRDVIFLVKLDTSKNRHFVPGNQDYLLANHYCHQSKD